MQTCEDLEDAASLRQLFDIFKGVIMLNDTSLMDLLFAEENVMDVVSPSLCLGKFTIADLNSPEN